jgi:hypothetical protein
MCFGLLLLTRGTDGDGDDVGLRLHERDGRAEVVVHVEVVVLVHACMRRHKTAVAQMMQESREDDDGSRSTGRPAIDVPVMEWKALTMPEVLKGGEKAEADRRALMLEFLAITSFDDICTPPASISVYG